MAFASSRNARTNSFTTVGTSPSVGGGRHGPLRGLPPGIGGAGKAGARKCCSAPASSLNGLRFLAQRPHQLLHYRRHVALSRRGPPRPPPRPPPGNRWRRQSRRSKVLLGSRIIAKWPSLPRATPAPTPSLPSARRPQSEGASTAPSEASPRESVAPAKPALESAARLPHHR